MPETVIHVRASREEIRRRIALLPMILSGRVPDQHGIARGFVLRLAVAFLEKVKLAFIAKSRGGTDEAGISWPPLSREYLAYGRRFGRGEQAALKAAAGLGRANRFAPGGNKGLLTASQLKRWNQVFASSMKWLQARGESLEEAKGHAAAIAWSTVKKEGARTKLDVFGSRQVEILRDTGVLFNSLSPGELSASGADAAYQAPDGQIVEHHPGELIVGTNVAYAAAHHKAKNPRRRRPLWPEADQIPQAWWSYFSRQAAGGMRFAVELIVGGRAA